MLSFSQFLLEYVSFASARDYDYPLSNNIVFISKNGKEVYRLQGQTHAEYSHAVKHYIEFNPAFVLQCGAKIKGIIQQAEKDGAIDYIELYNINTKKYIRGFDQVYAKAKPLDYLNMLDYLNDKNMEKEHFNNVEVQIKNVGNEIRKKYDEIITNILDNAVSLDDKKVKEINSFLKNNPTSIISFSVKASRGINIYFLDLANNVLLVKFNGQVTTCYKINKKATGLDIIKNFAEKRDFLKYVNTNVKEVFNDLVKRNKNF